MCDEEGEESCHDIHTCSGTCSVWEGEEEAWLRGAHISPVSHPHSTERL